MSYYFLGDELYFPPVIRASSEGVVAIGGDLSEERLLLAYQSGIFPWFSDGEPIIWWSPDPRFVLYPSNIKISKSMQQLLRKNAFEVTFDKDFEQVILNCKKIKREGQKGTWITDDMVAAYYSLHQKGVVHSVEVWQSGVLVGGLYGLSLGDSFFGESMFAKVSNASKYGFITLVKALEKKGFSLIDCQVHTDHLESLGAEYIPRKKFLETLKKSLQKETLQGNWGVLLTN
ncbi:MAG: leucyl/phenylalanyl-tRNA--protein transferase [Raineya sp.]|jgi:leucyl/phenylalanyl-tRNA--protein transferase|nr:leucyl/phenylalanyl-tRNA--protein transferase [Raineya sp.]